MMIKRLFLFVALIALCVAASSLNLNQSVRMKYAEYQRLAAEGNLDAAEFGFRRLVMQYPYTAAGMDAAKTLVEGGASPVLLGLDVIRAGIRNTTAAEWLLLISAFFVVVVFMGSNVLPQSILLLFILSGAGVFHLSHPLISIDNRAIDAFLAINPFIYLALALFIAWGYLQRRWEVSGQMAYHQAFVRRNLFPGEQLLVAEMYSEKMKILQEQAEAIEGELQTPHGRHFVKEVKRINEAVKKELQAIKKEYESTQARHQDTIRAAEEAIRRAQQEQLENRILCKSKAIGRGEYRRIRLEKESITKKNRQRISETNAALDRMKTVRLENRLQFIRRDLFLAYLHASFIDRSEGLDDIILKQALFHPKAAEVDIRKRKIIYRKSSDVGGRLLKLEQRRSKMKDAVYAARLEPLTNEKIIIDKALLELAEQISIQADSCSRQIEKLEDATQALTAELEDMKALRKVRNCFPSHVKARIHRIRQVIRLGKRTLPLLRRIEKIYGEVPA